MGAKGKHRKSTRRAADRKFLRKLSGDEFAFKRFVKFPVR